MTVFDYLPFPEAAALWKQAEEKKRPSELQRLGRMAKALVLPAAAFGGGMAVGFGTGQLADLLHKKVTGQKIPEGTLRAIAPTIGSAVGLTYGLYQSHALKELRRAYESDGDDTRGRNSGR